jgi:hypothetical protein
MPRWICLLLASLGVLGCTDAGVCVCTKLASKPVYYTRPAAEWAVPCLETICTKNYHNAQ